jgi:hypothetical protein
MLRVGHRSLLTGMGARLGLLAVVLQLVLSFAHIHPLPAPAAVLSAPAGNSTPDMPQADGACAICAGIAAFAALDLPPQADLVRPVSVAEILAPAAAADEYCAAFSLPFSSRAPPVA